MHVVGLTRRPESLPPHVAPVTKDALFAQADVVVLCCVRSTMRRVAS